jgi:hypothetical protein
MSERSRTGLLVAVILALLAGMFIGALGTTVLLRTSIGSAGDLKAREAIALQALIAAPDGIAGPDLVHARATQAFAASFVNAAASLDATASLEDRQRIVDIARWIDAGDALSAQDSTGASAWAQAAAACIVATPDAPRDAAKCVKAAAPAAVTAIPD